MHEALYDELARVERTHWWFQGRKSIVSSVLRRYLPNNDGGRTISDIGSGTGEMLDMLRQFGKVSGLDMSSKAVGYCHARFGDDVIVRVGRIPDDISPAHIITAFDVLEHLDDDAAALAAVHRALPAGGHFVCTVPAFQSLWSTHDEIHHHRRRYRRRQLRHLLESVGLEVVQITYFNSTLLPIAAVARLLSRLGGRRTDAHSPLLTVPPPPVNRALRLLFSAERRLLRVAPLPAGLSLLAIARRPV